jgi:hypothetical protein
MEGKSKSIWGIGIGGVVTGVLIALKLAGIIQCSWTFAFTPLLIDMGIRLLILLILLLWVKWQERSW